MGRNKGTRRGARALARPFKVVDLESTCDHSIVPSTKREDGNTKKKPDQKGIRISRSFSKGEAKK